MPCPPILQEPSTHYGIFYRPRIFHPLGSVQHLQPDDVAVPIVVEDHAGLVLIALFDRGIAEQDEKHIQPGVVSDFQVVLQYLGPMSSFSAAELMSPHCSPMLSGRI